jgi:hypothetical protein
MEIGWIRLVHSSASTRESTLIIALTPYTLSARVLLRSRRGALTCMHGKECIVKEPGEVNLHYMTNRGKEMSSLAKTEGDINAETRHLKNVFGITLPQPDIY